MKPESQVWRLDPNDPRAPTPEQWAAMSEEEQQRVYDSLPIDPIPLQVIPEGDLHFDAKQDARDTLKRWFGRRGGRSAYVGIEKAVYYDGQPTFNPDVFVVLDVDPGPRDSWIVHKEGRGLDWVLEVIVKGDRKKDLERNVQWYASLGIPEYFVFDVRDRRLWGWRLSPDANRYDRLVQQLGVFRSDVLDLELGLVGARLRFFAGGAPLPTADDLVKRLGTAVDEVTARAEEAAKRAEEEAKRAEEEAKRADSLAARLEALEAQLRELRGEE